MSKKFILSTLFVATLVGGYLIFRNMRSSGARSLQIRSWFRDPEEHIEWQILQGERCGDAPFILPTDGIIGYLWDDSFRPGHRHQGLDIFGGQELGDAGGQGRCARAQNTVRTGGSYRLQDQQPFMEPQGQGPDRQLDTSLRRQAEHPPTEGRRHSLLRSGR